MVGVSPGLRCSLSLMLACSHVLKQLCCNLPLIVLDHSMVADFGLVRLRLVLVRCNLDHASFETNAYANYMVHLFYISLAYWFLPKMAFHKEFSTCSNSA